jgi:hypothetical protein
MEEETMSGMSAGVTRFKVALAAVGARPLRHLALVAAGVVGTFLTPLWGATFVNMGWLDARRRVANEGLVGLGSAFAPEQARGQYADGVWTGLWRVHTLPVAFCAVQLPGTLFAMLPAVLVFGLMMPAGTSYDGLVALVLSVGVPAVVAAACLVAVTAQTMLMLRLLGRSGPSYSVGLVFRTVGVAWRGTLNDLSALMGLGASLAGAMLAAATVTGISAWLATAMKLGAGGATVVAQWTAAVLAFIVVAVALEALAQWSDEVSAETIDGAGAWNFSVWLREWLTAAIKWFASKGVFATGTGVCLAVGTVVAGRAVVTENVWDSWPGVAWFAVSATVLVTLHRTGRTA